MRERSRRCRASQAKFPRRSWTRGALAERDAWRIRLQNYQHALLFTLRRRKRGIHKYYCGWDTFTHLADGNIRYLLHLVSESLIRHVDNTETLEQPVPVEDQTLASQEDFWQRRESRKHESTKTRNERQC